MTMLTRLNLRAPNISERVEQADAQSFDMRFLRKKVIKVLMRYNKPALRKCSHNRDFLTFRDSAHPQLRLSGVLTVSIYAHFRNAESRELRIIIREDAPE